MNDNNDDDDNDYGQRPKIKKQMPYTQLLLIQPLCYSI